MRIIRKVADLLAARPGGVRVRVDRFLTKDEAARIDGLLKDAADVSAPVAALKVPVARFNELRTTACDMMKTNRLPGPMTARGYELEAEGSSTQIDLCVWAVPVRREGGDA